MSKNLNELTLNIQAHSNHFSDSQKIIASYLINNSHDILNHDINTLSKKLYISKATISRFAQRIGYSGFKEMHFAYQVALKNENIEDEEVNNITDLFISNYKHIIDYLRIVANEDSIHDVCECINSASRCFIVGISTSGLVAEDFSQRLARIGYNAQGIRDNHFMRMQAAMANKKDLFIVFSYSGETVDIIHTITKAKSRGAKVILITEFYNSTSSKLADYILLTPPKNSVQLKKSISDQLPLLLIADIIYYNLFQDNYELKSNLFESTLINANTK